VFPKAGYPINIQLVNYQTNFLIMNHICKRFRTTKI